MFPSVRYELHQFEVWVIEAGKHAERDLPQLTVNYLHDSFHKEAHRIQQQLIQEVFTFDDEKHLERYIQYHQSALIRLMDLLRSVTTSEKFISDTNTEELLYVLLHQLLAFVERHFSKYFDLDAKAPISYISIAQSEAQANYDRLIILLHEGKASPAIVEVILNAFIKMQDKESDTFVTYRFIFYLKDLARELFLLLEGEWCHLNIDEELRYALYYMNYNTVTALAYHARYIQSLIAAHHSRSEKTETLSLLLKKINQAQVKPGVSFNPAASSLKTQLISYLQEEIDHLERTAAFTLTPPTPTFHRPAPAFKIKFEISVAQLSYLVRILFETRIITNSNVTEALKAISRSSVSKKSETISYASLRSKFYNIEDATRTSLKNKLKEMITYIDQR